jgi:hypothetical protein
MGVKVARTSWLLGALALACSDPAVDAGWVATGAQAAFPAPLTVSKATATNIDGTYLYWLTSDGFLYRAPRAGGEIHRRPLPAPATIITAHNDVFVGWTDAGGNAAIEEIDPVTGKVTAEIHQTGALLGLVAGQRGYGFAVAAPDGTRVQACRDGICTDLIDIPSAYKSLALDFPTRTFYVLTADGLRTCSLDTGCPAQAATTPAGTKFVADLPGVYFLMDANGQPHGSDGSMLGSPAAPGPIKWEVVDGNGYVATWSNGSQLAQCTLAAGATTTQMDVACSDFETDATGRPIYCLVGSSMIQVIP